MTELEVRLKIGRPADREIERAVLDIVDTLKVATSERVRREVGIRLGRSVSWNTVRKYLERASDQGELDRRVVSKKKRNMVAFYSKQFL